MYKVELRKKRSHAKTQRRKGREERRDGKK